MYVRIAVTAAVAAVVGAAIWLALSAAPQPARAAAPGQLLLLFNSNGSAQALKANARRYNYFVLQPWDIRGYRIVKARNPHAIVLAYQNLSAMAKGPRAQGVVGSGVGYDEADGQHEDWFLHDGSGNRITENAYYWLYMADVGNRGYQARWAHNVLRLMKRGWDGVFADDTNATVKYHTDRGRVVKYPNDSAYQAATGSMLAYVGPRLRRAHKLMIANMGAWVEHPGVVKRWLRYVDGGQDEQFAKFSPNPGQGYRDPHQWRIQVDEARTAAKMGKRFFAVTHATPDDLRAKLFGWATFLLAAGPRSGYLAAPNYEVPPVPLPSSARNVGKALSGMHRAGEVYFRSYSKALVVVNPSFSPQHVSFTKKLSGIGLGLGSEATLAPQSGLVLHPGGSVAHATSGLGDSVQPPVIVR